LSTRVRQCPQIAGVTLSHCGHHDDARTDAEVDALFDRLTARIDEATPARACDAAGWASTWRAWAVEHAGS